MQEQPTTVEQQPASATLRQLGYSDRFRSFALEYPDLHPARVVSQSKDIYKVCSEQGELLAEVSGKLRFEAQDPTEFPAVGDFVLLDRLDDAKGNAIIHAILPRKSVFVRKAAGTAGQGQIVASNIDLVFICMALNADYNVRRLERYLSIAWDSGAIPMVVLTKSDLCDNLDQVLAEVEAIALGVEILVTSALEQDGWRDLLKFIQPEQTIALIGSSGVGKSTLLNCLLGEERFATQGLDSSDKGRHTTTRRELTLLPGGGLVIDTPGMREIGLDGADLGKTFADIEDLARQCKFFDCTHDSEPGCAVRQAMQNGLFGMDRLEAYRKLQHETSYQGLNSKQIETEKLNRMLGQVGGMKNMRKFVTEKYRIKGVK